LTVASVLVVGGCSPEEAAPDPEAAAQAQADSVMMASEMFDDAAFDTIAWDSFEGAQERGEVVFRFSCRKCHGETGLGDGGYVSKGEVLTPPSFLAEDWQFAEDRAGLRKKVFTGTATGMPHWGFYGLTHRDIDAVATHIQEVLRQ
jgi:mono/diheme cytochrome c family protein